ncbi:phosphatase PAP2 family protein [Halorarum salinum]|uniref:Inositol phosphorylceramide synthase n=1 Tax=Halorarum salinum TaxID=2743089 RepID=A0A7D5LCV5_9EURY|nr:phosphatase PAP2 family protein [Halobaculum salinum]QLG63591.1 inositol phosphorylceramide synthase [Halobaculum salinum]
MSILTTVLLQVVVVVTVLCIGGAAMLVRGGRLELLRRDGRARVHEVAPAFVALGAALAVNAVVRDHVPKVAWLVGVNITGYIHAIEGGFVPWLQTFATPAATAYFSATYVFGYTFVLVFPLLAYLLHPDPRHLRELAVAYGLNYVIGLVCYAVFVAYGPRNLLADQVEPLLYSTYPQYMELVAQVNTNTNVFPSLHTSLSLTVAAFAVRTRDTYPAWAVVAPVLAGSIVVATMYLGIHWATDVVAGALLAALCVTLARRGVPAAVVAHVRSAGRRRVGGPGRWL